MARPKKAPPAPLIEEVAEPVTSKVIEVQPVADKAKFSAATLREMEAGRKALAAKIARDK